LKLHQPSRAERYRFYFSPGVVKLPLVALSAAVQKKYGCDPKAAAEFYSSQLGRSASCRRKETTGPCDNAAA
jgi:hypothetical protein